jgi:hypothetical protein
MQLWLTPVILATWETQNKRISVQVQPKQKVSKIPSQSIAGYSGGCVSLCLGSINREIIIQPGQGKTQDSIPKITKAGGHGSSDRTPS